MRQIFGGWKRKIGVVMVVMARVFMAGWLGAPLTLLAAYLLLGKPREVTTKKTSKPIPAEGA